MHTAERSCAAALLACTIGPLAGQNVVLTVVQLLLVNIVMDTLAALAALVLPADLIRNLLCRR